MSTQVEFFFFFWGGEWGSVYLNSWNIVYSCLYLEENLFFPPGFLQLKKVQCIYILVVCVSCLELLCVRDQRCRPRRQVVPCRFRLRQHGAKIYQPHHSCHCKLCLSAAHQLISSNWKQDCIITWYYSNHKPPHWHASQPITEVVNILNRPIDTPLNQSQRLWIFIKHIYSRSEPLPISPENNSGKFPMHGFTLHRSWLHVG